MRKYFPKDDNGNEITFPTYEGYIFDRNNNNLSDKLDEIMVGISNMPTADNLVTDIAYDSSDSSVSLLSASGNVIDSTTIPSGSGTSTMSIGQCTNINVTRNNGVIKVTWNDPNDTVLNSLVLATWGSTTLVYRTDRYPTSINDGTVAVTYSDVKNKYQTNGYTINLGNNDVLYFKLFPAATTGSVNTSSSNNFEVKKATIYGFHINNNDSNPSTCVSYLPGCDNYGFTPASMNYGTSEFDWGSWSDSDFFVPRPCVLKFDGTVEYYLNPNEYTKKYDNTTATIDNTAVGNIMMEWGRNGKRIYYKFVTSGTDAGYTCSSISPNVYISDTQVDSGYHCWSFYDDNNNLKDHFYTACYNVYKDSSNRLRSVSGYTATDSLTGTTEITYATNNGSGWYTGTYGDTILINMLLVMLGKSLDTQSVYGQGNTSGSSYIDTGNLNSKGLFWGSSGTTSAVKVFGMENYWGNYNKRIAGYVTDASYNQLIKLTPNTADGSTVTAYNTTGDGYLNMGNNGISSSKEGYIKSWNYNNNGVMTIKANDVNSTGTGASAYYCDKGYVGASYYAFQGGYRSNGSYCGAFYLYLSATVSISNWYIVGSLSFR